MAKELKKADLKRIQTDGVLSVMEKMTLLPVQQIDEDNV